MNPQFDIMITTACNARCPFCVQEATYKSSQGAEESFLRALRTHFSEFWRQGGRRVVITGGEPLLMPGRVLSALKVLADFPDLEVKAVYTHGRNLLRRLSPDGPTVAEALRDAGLGCVNLSVHHFDNVVNCQLMGLPPEPTIERMTAHLRKVGLPFRLNGVLQRGAVTTLAELVHYVDWGFSLGATDIYLRELFDIRLTHVRTNTDRQSVEYCHHHRVPVIPLVHGLEIHPAFELVNEVQESFRDKTEWEFVYGPAQRRLFLSRLVIGTECPDDLPYLVLMPDGLLYRGWLGEEDRIASLVGYAGDVVLGRLAQSHSSP